MLCFKLIKELLLEILDGFNGNIIEVSLCNGINDSNLTANSYRRISALFENFHNTLTKGKTCLCISVKVTSEL